MHGMVLSDDNPSLDEMGCLWWAIRLVLTEYTCFGFYVTFQIIKPEIFCYLKTPNKILFLHNTIFRPLRQKIWRETQLFLAQIACISVSAHFSSEPFRGGSCHYLELSATVCPSASVQVIRVRRREWVLLILPIVCLSTSVLSSEVTIVCPSTRVC